jgi:hypothetical protein
LLQELEVKGLEDQMLHQIELKALRCFKFDEDINFESESWESFCKNHPQLERLEVSGHYFENLLDVVKALPCLKTLLMKNVCVEHYLEEEIIIVIEQKIVSIWSIWKLA